MPPCRDARLKFPGHVGAHLAAHEHGVGAEVNDAVLLVEQRGGKGLDLRIDERFAAADAHHRRAALGRRAQAFFQGHQVLERGAVFPDASAAGAGEVAGVEGLQLEHGGEFFVTAQFVADDVLGDFAGQGERESHGMKRDDEK